MMMLIAPSDRWAHSLRLMALAGMTGGVPRTADRALSVVARPGDYSRSHSVTERTRGHGTSDIEDGKVEWWWGSQECESYKGGRPEGASERGRIKGGGESGHARSQRGDRGQRRRKGWVR